MSVTIPDDLAYPERCDEKERQRLGTEFRWKTFGVTIDSTVRHERLAWDAHCDGEYADRGVGFPCQ
jgi:hypothetical protein